MSISKGDRYRGAMVGALAGDALLAPYETKTFSQILADVLSRGGIVPHDYIEPFNRKRIVSKGHPTDDAELTAALALGLQSTACVFDAGEIYQRLRGFIHGIDGNPRQSVLTTGQAYGSGGTLRSALRAETYDESIVLFREGRVKVLPTNGSLMRNTPIALRYDPDIRMAAEMARRQSCITHIHSSAQVACIVHALLMLETLKGLEPRDAWKSTKAIVASLLAKERETKDKMLVEDFEKILAMTRHMPMESEIWPHTGEVLLSFRIALSAFLSADDFRHGITQVALVGGDTDTYGAIAGGLLGAHFGLEGIPSEWRATLMGQDIMIDLADKLYHIAHPNA